MKLSENCHRLYVCNKLFEVNPIQNGRHKQLTLQNTKMTMTQPDELKCMYTFCLLLWYQQLASTLHEW